MGDLCKTMNGNSPAELCTSAVLEESPGARYRKSVQRQIVKINLTIGVSGSSNDSRQLIESEERLNPGFVVFRLRTQMGSI